MQISTLHWSVINADKNLFHLTVNVAFKCKCWNLKATKSTLQFTLLVSGVQGQPAGGRRGEYRRQERRVQGLLAAGGTLVLCQDDVRWGVLAPGCILDKARREESSGWSARSLSQWQQCQASVTGGEQLSTFKYHVTSHPTHLYSRLGMRAVMVVMVVMTLRGESGDVGEENLGDIWTGASCVQQESEEVSSVLFWSSLE